MKLPQLSCLDLNVTGDRTYPPPDPSPSLRSDARDNPPDRSTWSAREPGGYEAGERVDDEVRVGRRVWVRHGHVSVTRPANHENRAGSEEVRSGMGGDQAGWNERYTVSSKQGGKSDFDGRWGILSYHIRHVTSHPS